MEPLWIEQIRDNCSSFFSCNFSTFVQKLKNLEQEQIKNWSEAETIFLEYHRNQESITF